MPGAGTSSGSKVIGETVIRDGSGNLLVQFSSLDAETPWGQRFQAARVKYAMLKRRERIPQFLRTGKCPFIIKIIFTLILERKLKKEVNHG
jgi:hypothetical protein